MESIYRNVAGSIPLKNAKNFQGIYFKERLRTTSTPANPACRISGEETLLIYTISLVLEDQRKQFTDHFKICKILRFDVWDKVSKSGLREFCGRQPLKNLLSSLLDTFFSYIYTSKSKWLITCYGGCLSPVVILRNYLYLDYPIIIIISHFNVLYLS